MICIKCENSIDEERQRNRQTNGNMHQKTHIMNRCYVLQFKVNRKSYIKIDIKIAN